MKKAIISALMLSILLVGCVSPVGDDNEQQAGKNTDEDRTEYYRALAASLEQELLSLRVSFYQERVAYEERIAELERALSLQTGTVEESDFRYDIADGKAIVIGYVGKGGAVTIPATLGGASVVGIADRAFENRTTITSVTLPSGVESLGWFAFAGCIDLQSVHIPASVHTIAYGAFLNCPSDMVVVCPSDSYAEQYAISYGIAVRNG